MTRVDRPVGQRQLRVGEELRHALARILERGEIRDPVLATVAVTVMPLGGREETSVLRALTRARGFLRRRIAQSVYLKFAPDLAFRVDRSFEQADRIARILRDPTVARDIEHDREKWTPVFPDG